MWCKAEFSASLLQSSVSYHANMLIWRSSNISYYYCDVENSCAATLLCGNCDAKILWWIAFISILLKIFYDNVMSTAVFISNTLRICVCISVNWWHVLWLRYQSMETHFLAILCKKHSDESGIESVCIDTATDSVTAVTFRTKLLTDGVAVVQPVNRRDRVINDLQLERFMERSSDPESNKFHQATNKTKLKKTHFV